MAYWAQKNTEPQCQVGLSRLFSHRSRGQSILTAAILSADRLPGPSILLNLGADSR